MHLAVREAISEFSMQRSGVAVLIDMEAFSRGRGAAASVWSLHRSVIVILIHQRLMATYEWT